MKRLILLGVLAAFFLICFEKDNAIGQTDGSLKWAFQTGAQVFSSPAIGTDGTIYVGSSDGKVYAINAADGSLKWAFQAGGSIYYSPAIGADGTVYLKDYALNPTDGSQKWAFPNYGGIYGPPTIAADGTVYVIGGGFYDSGLYAINPTDGSQKWAFQGTGGYYTPGLSSSIGANGTVYFHTSSGNLYAINPEDGRPVWSFQTNFTIMYDCPTIGADGTIYFGGTDPYGNDGSFYAINPIDGKSKWVSPIIGMSSAIGADGTVFVSSFDHRVYALNPTDGSQKWAFQTGAQVFSSPAIGTDGTIYVGSYDGKVYAINSSCGGLANTPWPIFQHDVRHSGCANRKPVANAGPDQPLAMHGVTVTLDGSGSSDPDGNTPLSYAWTILSKPAGSSADLSNPAAVSPTFEADRPGDYVVQLIVTDSKGLASDPDTVTITTGNATPVAEAGENQAIIEIGATVTLHGTQSWDPDDLTASLTFAWDFTNWPGKDDPDPAPKPTLSDASSQKPTFTADKHGTYEVQLIVTDPWGASSSPDKVTISFTNIKPVANAGENQSVLLGATVNLNGSASDENHDSLTYKWSFTTWPEGYDAPAFSPDDKVLAPSFLPTVPGDYVAQLVAYDGFAFSDASTVSIHVAATPSWVSNCLRTLINNLPPPEAFKNKNLRNTLINKLNAVIKTVDAGNYAEALAKLQEDILAKTDGCYETGQLDNNDWVVLCADQSALYEEVREIMDDLTEVMNQP